MTERLEDLIRRRQNELRPDPGKQFERPAFATLLFVMVVPGAVVMAAYAVALLAQSFGYVK